MRTKLWGKMDQSDFPMQSKSFDAERLREGSGNRENNLEKNLICLFIYKYFVQQTMQL
jgi:hypothetical protein